MGGFIMTKDSFHSAILAFAAGDALGAPAEFGERWMRDMDPVKEMRSGGIFEVPAGGWTDDTSMVLATLDSLKNGFDPIDLMQKFIAWLRNAQYCLFDEPIGIGKQILRAIEQYETSGDIHTCAGIEERDNGNGSLMRILPVCLYCHGMDAEKAIEIIHAASALTHRHMRSKIACGLYFFLCEAILSENSCLESRMQSGIDRGFLFYKNEPELSHYRRIRSLADLKEIHRDDIASSGYVVDTMEAALWCLVTENSLKASLLRAVNLGLDTDTIAAVAGGLAGLYYGMEGIPAEWLAAIQKRDVIEEYINAGFPEICI